jgi:hypothetical protein
MNYKNVKEQYQVLRKERGEKITLSQVDQVFDDTFNAVGQTVLQAAWDTWGAQPPKHKTKLPPIRLSQYLTVYAIYVPATEGGEPYKLNGKEGFSEPKEARFVIEFRAVDQFEQIIAEAYKAAIKENESE